MSSVVGSAPFFTPTQISGCELWLDAADRGTLSLLGTSVTQWRDKSTNAYVCNGAEGTSPTYTSSLNGVPVISSATGQKVTITNFNQNFTVATMFFLIRPTQNVVVDFQGYPIFRGVTGAGTIQLDVSYYNQSPYYYYLQIWTTNSFILQASLNTSGSFNPTDLPLLMTGVVNGISNGNIGRYNGSVLGTTPLNNATNFVNLSGVTIDVIGASDARNFDTAEIVLYSRLLTTQEIEQVEGYLAWKWGLQANLPAGHPYKNSVLGPLLNPPITFTTITQGTNPFWSPIQLPNCRLWLDASDRSTISLSNGFVSGMNDKSGNNYNMTRVYTAGFEMTNTNTLNGLNTLYFPNDPVNNNNTRTYLRNTTSFTTNATQHYCIFVMRFNPYVLEGTSTARGWGQVFPFVTNVVQGFQCGLTRSGSNWFLAYGMANVGNRAVGTTLISGSSSGPSVGTPILCVIGRSSSNSYTISLNGTIQTITGATTNAASGQVNIGVYFQNQELCELFFYNGVVLTTDQIQQAEGYLAWKWGLQGNLPVTHPYKSFPPINPSLAFPPRSSLVRGTWLPTSITGCAIWFDAADTTTITQSATGSISQWRSKGTTANVATTTLGSAPTYSNIQRGVNYTGSQAFTVTNAGAVAQNVGFVSLFLVGTMRTVAVSTTFFFFSTTANGSQRLHFKVDTVTGAILALVIGTRRLDGDAGFDIDGTQAVPTNQRILVNMEMNYSIRTGYLYINGILGGSPLYPTAGLTSNTASVAVTMGNRPTSGYVNYDGFMNEVIVYNQAYTTDQRQQMEGYLAWKWGLQTSLPANHPYKLWPPPP
jgi:hypothetical protein